MARSGVEIDGLNRLVRDLKRAGVEVDDLKNAFGSIANEAASRIRRLTPKRTGRLAADVRGSRAQRKAVVKVGRAAIPYAGPINFGWRARNIAPSRFMQRGDQQMRPVAARRLEDEINAVIRRRGLR